MRILKVSKVDGRLWIEGDGFCMWAWKARIDQDFVDFYDEKGYVLATFHLERYSLSFPTELRDILIKEEVVNG